MFGFKAYYWNNDVYINEKHRFAVGEILADVINKFRCVDELKETKHQLKQLKQALIIEEDKSYWDIENYNSNVYKAESIFNELNEISNSYLPYRKINKHPSTSFTDILNGYGYMFEDGIQDRGLTDIDWDTVTEYGTGECSENGNFYIHIHKFVPCYLNEKIKELDTETLLMIHEYNQMLEMIFNAYINFIDTLIIIENIFKPFIEEHFLNKITFPTDYQLAESFDTFNKKHSFDFNNIDCKMTSFRYKSIKDEHGRTILCEEIEFKDFQSFLYYDFFYAIKRNYIVNKCRNCGEFFLIQSGKYMSYCDNPLADDKNKTCRDVGAKRKYDDKCKNDPIWQTYNRAYKAHYARYMKKKMTISEFEKWSRYASDLRDKALAGKIEFEQYYADIRK